MKNFICISPPIYAAIVFKTQRLVVEIYIHSANVIEMKFYTVEPKFQSLVVKARRRDESISQQIHCDSKMDFFTMISLRRGAYKHTVAVCMTVCNTYTRLCFYVLQYYMV